MTNHKTYGPLLTGPAGGKPKPATLLKRKVTKGKRKRSTGQPLNGDTVYINADKNQ